MQLSVHTSLGSPEAPAQAAVDAARLWARHEYAELGHEDFAYTARELAATCAEKERHRWITVLAKDGDECVGLAIVYVPDVDNRHLIGIDWRIDPTAEVTPVLDGLWSVVADLMDAEERDTAVAWLPSAVPGEVLRPRTGAGAVRRTRVTDWLVAHRFELEQAEVASTLQVEAALAPALELEKASAGASPEYDVVAWVGATPPDLQDAMAEQRARMSTDVPLGDVALEPEVWDAARVRDEDRIVLAMGRTALWTAAIERATGAVVAHTMLACPDGLPEVAFQEDTLVRAEHRGHRLGMRVKAANLRHLAAQRPSVRRIHTWNADENHWMLAINRDLGFRPTSVMGCWQLKNH